MENKAPFYLHKLRTEFGNRTQKNPRYSLRAFARFLEIEPQALSCVLKGTRGIPKNKIDKVLEKLCLSPKETAVFKTTNASRRLLQKTKLSTFDFVLDDELHFNVIAEWEYYAIINLFNTKGFKSDYSWIAERLNLTDLRVQTCIESLIQLNLVKETKFGLKLTKKSLETTEDISSAALKKARKQDLELAESTIDNAPLDMRDLSSICFTLNPKDIAELKLDIREFRRKLAAKAERKKGTEVYKLSVQMIPLTKLNITGDKK